MSADHYVVHYIHHQFHSITGPYTPEGAKRTASYWKRKRKGRQTTIITASSVDAAYAQIGVNQNPLNTKSVLLGLTVLGAVGAVLYAVNASAKPAATTPTSSGPTPTPTSGSSPAPLSPVGTNQNEAPGGGFNTTTPHGPLGPQHKM